MTREKLGAYRDQFYASLDTHHMPRESIAESVFDRVCNALEAVMDERDQLKHRVRELEEKMEELAQQKKMLIEEIMSLEKEYGRG